MLRRMFRSGYFWADYFNLIFIPEIEAYAACLTERLLSSFENLSDEANRVEQEEYERLCRLVPYEYDDASLAEHAMDKAIAYIQTITGIKQGLINMFGAGLYHFFEQQLLSYHRREFLFHNLEEHNDPDLLKVTKVCEICAENGIDLKSIASWSRIYDELRLLANTVKHADGWACDQLRSQRPDLFRSPTSVKLGSFLVSPVVYQPLAGDGIYLSEEEFKRYTEDVKAFWPDFSVL